MVLLRHLLGDALRRLRLRQGRTLREVSAAARVSLGYLSEVERGRKEASSELLASICNALGAPLSQVLREVSDTFALAELQNEPVFAGVREPSLEMPAASQVGRDEAGKQPVGTAASQPVLVPAGPRQPLPAGQRLVMPKARQDLAGRQAQHFVASSEPLREAALPATQPVFDQVKRTVRDITDMIPV